MADSMKTTDFMLNLAKQLMDERKIAESTATQYLQTLFKLNNSKPFNNLAWTKKTDVVQSVIDTYAESTQGNQYMVLASALSPYSSKPTYKKAYEHWKNQMMEARKKREETPQHEKSDKQEENWLTWEEINKKKSELKEEILLFLSSKHISNTQYDKLLSYVVLSLYTDIQPRRNQDYLDMYVVKKLGKDADTNKNYYDISTQRFVFNKYKTARKHGSQIVEIPETLQQTLSDFLKHHPLTKTKAKEYKLLVKHDGSPLTIVNAITRILNKIFGKRIGSSMLRHIYLSSKYGNVLQEMEKDSATMAHSTSQQKEYIKYD